MSWLATAYVKGLRVGANGAPLDRSEKLVLYGLADYYNDESGAAWPGAARLAEESLLSRRSLFRVIDRLVEKGLVTVERRENSAGAHQANVYRLPGLPFGPSGRRGDSDTVTPPPSQRGSDTVTPLDSAENGHGVTPLVTPLSHHPSDSRSHHPSDSIESPKRLREPPVEPQDNPQQRRSKPESRDGAPLPGGGAQTLSLGIPADQADSVPELRAVSAALLTIDGGRRPELPDVVARHLEQCRRCVDAGLTGDELLRRWRKLKRDHPTWTVNVSTVLSQGHTVAAPPSAPPAAPEPPAGENPVAVTPAPQDIDGQVERYRQSRLAALRQRAVLRKAPVDEGLLTAQAEHDAEYERTRLLAELEAAKATNAPAGIGDPLLAMERLLARAGPAPPAAAAGGAPS